MGYGQLQDKKVVFLCAQLGSATLPCEILMSAFEWYISSGIVAKNLRPGRIFNQNLLQIFSRMWKNAKEFWKWAIFGEVMKLKFDGLFFILVHYYDQTQRRISR